MARRLRLWYAPVALVPLAILIVAGAPPLAVALDEADRLWLVGERASADGLHPLARHVLERFVKEYPSDPRLPDAIYTLGRTRLALGEVESALDLLRRAQVTQPPPPWRLEARFWEGEALFRLKRYVEARAAYDEVLRTDAASPRAPEALYGMAFADLEAPQPARAAGEFEDFLKAWPSHALAPSAAYHQARAFVELKRTSEAVLILMSFPSKYGGHRLVPDAKFLLGSVRLSVGDRREGLAELRGFVGAYPTHPQAPAARRLIIETVGKSGDRDEMVEMYKTLTTQVPLTADGLAEAAALAGRLKRPADQEAAWRKLRASFPGHPLARRASLDLAGVAFQRKDWKEAASLARAASEDDGLRAEALLLEGEAELKQKRYAPALKAFDAVEALDGAEPGVRYRALAGAGLAHEAQQEWRRALAAYESVAARSPDLTLRDWAKQRAAEVRPRAAKAPGAAKPAPRGETRPDGKSDSKTPAKPGGRS